MTIPIVPEARSHTSARELRIAFIVPVRNRSDLAERTIRELVNQINGRDLIIVSDNSTYERERDRVRRLTKSMGPSLRYQAPARESIDGATLVLGHWSRLGRHFDHPHRLRYRPNDPPS